MEEKNKKYLLQIARQTLEHYFATNEKLQVDPEQVPEELKKQRGTFVTLTIAKQLRGCVGHLVATKPIFQDVIDSVLAAAFEDNRFLPLQQNELQTVSIEISVLDIPEKLNYFSVNDLLEKLIPFVDGVIIQKNNKSATYLPQVWEEISTKEDFLSSLCLKAGLPEDEWEKGDLEVWVYKVESFSE